MGNILILDDDPVYADMAKQRLERANHHVQVHLGPFGANVAMADETLDLILLDVFMPALSGLDVLSITRKNYPQATARVLLCSSMDPRQLAALARERGLAGSISKGAPRSEFLDAVERALIWKDES